MQHKWIVEHVCDPAKQKQVKKLEKFIKVELQKCDRCNQEFSNADAFDCHKFSVCLTDPIFMCVECGKECVDQHRLNLHKRVHDNQKFICDDCGQCFASEVGGACKQFNDFVKYSIWFFHFRVVCYDIRWCTFMVDLLFAINVQRLLSTRRPSTIIRSFIRSEDMSVICVGKNLEHLTALKCIWYDFLLRDKLPLQLC
jgi:hypothetical protein